MKILLLAIGRTKERWCREGEAFYEKRLQPFCDFQKTELPEEKITATVTETEVKKREAEKLLKQIPPDYFTVALSPDGKKMTSEEFAGFLGKIRNERGGKVAFLIGGPLGLSAEILAHANQVISFSALTFPHDLFRIILLEQIYRGFMILAGKKYHK